MFSHCETDYRDTSLLDFLPDNFYEEIIDKEYKLSQGGSNLKEIKDLLYLYSVAVEHFESKANNKYLDFQEKIYNLLSNPLVLNIISKNNSSRNNLFTQIKEKETHSFCGKEDKINDKELKEVNFRNSTPSLLLEKTVCTLNENSDATCTIISNDSLSSLNYMINTFNNPKKKVKKTMKEFKDCIEQYLKDYNVIFNKQCFNSFQLKLKEILSEKYSELMLVKESYWSHIKEIDLITTNDDYEKNSHLKEIIDSLKEELNSELKKVELYYDRIIDDLYISSKNIACDSRIYNNFTSRLKETLSNVIEMKR